MRINNNKLIICLKIHSDLVVLMYQRYLKSINKSIDMIKG